MSTPPLLPHIQVISPHRDDAAFSLALTIVDFCRAGAHVSIVNCFTTSHYTPLAPQLLPAEALEVRRREDLRFAQTLPGIDVIDLHFRDAPLRLGTPIEDLCLSRLESATKVFDPDSPQLEQSFLRLPAVDLTLIPLALGGHIDHLLARDTSLSAFKTKPIVFYQDLPYASRFKDVDSEVEAILVELNVSCASLTKHYDDAIERKFRYISAYSSQASKEELRAIASYPGRERLWLTEPAAWLKNL